MFVITAGVVVVLVDIQYKLTNKAIYWKLEYLSLNHFHIYQTNLFVAVNVNSIGFVSIKLFTRVSRTFQQTDIQSVPVVQQVSLIVV
jgi:hypothetical protein